MLRLGAASLIGGIVGALLLLRLPAAAFDAIVPVLIGIGCVLVIIQPALSRRVAARRERLGRRRATGARLGLALARDPADRGLRRLLRRRAGGAADRHPRHRPGRDAARINAVKNVLAVIVNGVAGVVFVLICAR